MDRTDALRVMAVLRITYPRFYQNASKEDANDAVTLWTNIFKNDHPRLVMAAVESFIESDEKGFPPVPGQIKAKMRLITEHDEMSELEAWGIVSNALRNSAYGAREEFDKFPPIIRRIVGSPAQLRDWGMMDSQVVHSVVASNFQRSYRAVAAKEREFEKLPPDIRELAARIAAAKSAPELPGDMIPELPETSAKSERVINTLTEHVREILESAWNPAKPPGQSGPRGNREEIIAILRSGKPLDSVEG